MALIKCPDCGSEVSSFATAYPRCGYPIAQNNPAGKTKIKLPPPSDHTSPTLRINSTATGDELARGNSNSIVEIDIDEPTEVALVWGLTNKPFKGNIFTIQPHKSYALSWGAGWMLPRLVVNEVSSFIGGA